MYQPLCLSFFYLIGDILDKTVSEHTIGPAAGSAHVGALRGMKGYVRPRPGTAENAALKRLRRKDATGMVAKVFSKTP